MQIFNHIKNGAIDDFQRVIKEYFLFLRMKAKTATILFIGCIVGARIAMGIFMSITGPTLPTLAANVDKSVKTTIVNLTILWWR